MTEWIVNSGTAQQSFEETIGETEASVWSLLALGYPSNSGSLGDHIYMPGTGSPVLTTGGRYGPQYFGLLQRNALRIACSENHGSVAKVFCWVRPDGKHVVTIRSTAAITTPQLTVTGIPPGIYDLTETTATVERVTRGAVTVNPGGNATLPTNAITAAGVLTMIRR